MLRNFEWKAPEEFHAGDDWMDVNCVQGGRDERIVCVLYMLSLGCIRNLSLVISGKTLGAQEGRGCVSERLANIFSFFMKKKNGLGLTFWFRLPGQK